MASHRIGRSVLNTTTCLWAMPIIRSRLSIRLTPLLSTTGSAKMWIWSPCASTIASAGMERQSRTVTDQTLSPVNLKPRHHPGLFSRLGSHCCELPTRRSRESRTAAHGAASLNYPWATLLARIHPTVIQLGHRAGYAFKEVATGVILPSSIAIVGGDSSVGPGWVIRFAEVRISRLGGVSVIPGGVSPSIIAG